MKYMINSLLLVFGICFLSSCGNGRTIVHEPVVIPVHMIGNQVEITHGKDTVCVSDDVRATFEKTLRKKLYGDNLIENAPGIQLKYRFVQFNEGNRLARYALGGIGNSGEASLMVEVVYYDCDEVEMGKIHTEGKISSGFLGGSCDNAVEKAAEEVANYTRNLVLCN